jgi:hypothetical protein
MKIGIAKLIVMIIVVVINSTSLLYAQALKNGVITGRVYNVKNNEPIPFVNIVVWGTNIGTTSDNDGNYTIAGVNPGYVEIRATSIGYEMYVSSPLYVTNTHKVYFEVAMNESATGLEEVVIKASPFRRNIESPVSLRTITIQEIEKNPGGNRDISKVIQSFPGVASTPAYRNDVVVRGGGSSENRFYLDGVEIPNLNHFATQGSSGGSVGIVNVDFIREVKFYSGAFPVNRGNALSSVLEFKQVEGNNEKLNFKGSVGASDLALTLNGPLAKNTTFIISARRSYLQFLFSALGLPFLPTYNDFQLKTHTNMGNKNELTIIGLGAFDHMALNLKANETEEQRYILRYLPVYNQWNYTLGAVYKHYRENGFDNWVVSRNMLYNTQYKYFNNIETPENKILDYESFESENKFRYENNKTWASGVKSNLGANFEYDRYYNSTFRQIVSDTSLKYESNMEMFRWGVFAGVSDEYFDKKLSLSLGVRADANNYSSDMNNLFKQFSPRISASYSITKDLFINFNTGRYYQIPPYTTLGYKDNMGNMVNKTNGLEYIQADHYVAGFDFLPTPDSKLSVEGFLKYYKNYPFSVGDSVALASKGADYGTFGDEEVVSTGKGRAYGAEFLYQNRNLFGTNITLSYSLVWSEFKNINGKYVPSIWDNRSLINVLIRKDLKNNWTVGMRWRYVGAAPYTPADLNKSSLVTAWDAQNRTYPDYSRFNELRLKPFHQLDMRIDKELYKSRWSLVFYVDVQNIYNFKSEQAPVYVLSENADGTPKPPIADSDPQRYELKQLKSDGSGSILPTVGIIIEY